MRDHPTLSLALRTSSIRVWRSGGPDRSERFPSPLIPLGDSVCRFNPVFGHNTEPCAADAVAGVVTGTIFGRVRIVSHLRFSAR